MAAARILMKQFTTPHKSYAERGDSLRICVKAAPGGERPAGSREIGSNPSQIAILGGPLAVSSSFSLGRFGARRRLAVARGV